MPKLCRRRLSVSEPFSWPITQTAAAQAADPSRNRLVVAERAVAGKGRKLGEQRADVVEEVGALRMTGDLSLLPGRQGEVEVGQGLGGASLEPHEFLADGHRVRPRRTPSAVPRSWPRSRPRAFRNRGSCAWISGEWDGAARGDARAVRRRRSRPPEGAEPDGSIRPSQPRVFPVAKPRRLAPASAAR